MDAALYEKLTGFYSDGLPIDDLPGSFQLVRSVLDNIQRILNSRSGSLKHLPDYGIPDLSMVYKNLPSSAHDLRYFMRKTLLKYELFKIISYPESLNKLEIELNEIITTLNLDSVKDFNKIGRAHV